MVPSLPFCMNLPGFCVAVQFLLLSAWFSRGIRHPAPRLGGQPLGSGDGVRCHFSSLIFFSSILHPVPRKQVLSTCSLKGGGVSGEWGTGRGNLMSASGWWETGEPSPPGSHRRESIHGFPNAEEEDAVLGMHRSLLPR